MVGFNAGFSPALHELFLVFSDGRYSDFHVPPLKSNGLLMF
jgi:hypothetical protein